MKLSEINWIGSLLIPIVIGVISAYFSFIINKKKTKAEIRKLEIDTKKAESEIEKLQIENAKLHKSFQPIVIDTLHSVQDKIINDKLIALKKLIEIRNELIYYKNLYDEDGDFIAIDYDEFLELVFGNYSSKKLQNYKDFYYNYSYFFPDKVMFHLEELFNELHKFQKNVTSYLSNWDPGMSLGKRDREYTKKVIDMMNKAITLIRKDCHLDSSIIHEFIEQNK